MKPEQVQSQDSHLFIVRLWREEIRQAEGWQGRVQDVLSGEAHTFDDWPMLIELLLEMAETDKAEVAKGIEGTGGSATDVAQTPDRREKLSR